MKPYYESEYGKLYLGDCIEIMASENFSCQMVLTDIPYGEVNRQSSGLRNLNKGVADIFDNNSIPKLSSFLHDVAKENIYVFCGTKQISPLVEAFESNKMSVRVGAWNKTNPSPMNGTRLWVSGLEFCVYARKANATHNEKCKKALWEFPSGRSKIHPTQKPVKLFEKLILASSSLCGAIFDPYIGSGTTAIAAINTGRKFIGIEKEEKYCEIAKQRIVEAEEKMKEFEV